MSVRDVEVLLTPRQRQVLDLLLEGRTNREIAAILGLSEPTAKFHVRNVLRRTGARTRVQVVVQVADEVLGDAARASGSSRLLAAGLTPRELDVARLAGAGLSNRAIASDLFIEVSTVKDHLERVYRKLAVSGRGQLVRDLWALEPSG